MVVRPMAGSVSLSGGATVDPWVKGIDAVTLFVRDLPAAKAFYLDVFGLPLRFEDPNSAVFMFGETAINLLDVREAPELIAPAAVATPYAGSRFQFTLAVDDVDAMCEMLQGRG